MTNNEWSNRVQSISCSKACHCSDMCTNRPFRKEKKVKIVKVSLFSLDANHFTSSHIPRNMNFLYMLLQRKDSVYYVSPVFFLKEDLLLVTCYCSLSEAELVGNSFLANVISLCACLGIHFTLPREFYNKIFVE